MIHQHAAVHLGLAIPLPGDLLVAPALFNAEQLDGESLSQARKALVDKAQTGKLSVKELTGATFTVSNLGLSRVHHFTPILNPPQVAILGVGGIQRRLELAERRTGGSRVDGPFADLRPSRCQRLTRG